MIKFAAFLIIGLMVTLTAHAAQAPSELSWVAPDTREDGSPLSPDEIKEYRVYYTVNGQTPGDNYPVVVSGTAQSETVTLELMPRAEPYVVGFAITTVDTDGVESVRSDVVSKTFNIDRIVKPSAPTNLQFNITFGDGYMITEKVGQ
jgi:hypothetical protein